MQQLMYGERSLKSWDYAQKKWLFFKRGTYNLTLTNRRLITSSTSKNSVEHDYVELSAIKGISASYSCKISFLKVLLGIIFCTALITMIIGIPLLLTCKRGQLVLNLCTEAESYEYILANSIAKKGFLARLFSPKTRFKVFPDVAKEIVETLPAELLNAKNQL